MGSVATMANCSEMRRGYDFMTYRELTMARWRRVMTAGAGRKMLPKLQSEEQTRLGTYEICEWSVKLLERRMEELGGLRFSPAKSFLTKNRCLES